MTMHHVKEKLRRALSISVVQCVLLSFILNFAIEILCRRSLFSALAFLFTTPIFFLIDWVIVFSTLTIALFFKRRRFLYILISTLWMALGITNCVLVLVRTAPFEAVDLSILRTGLGIITIYMEIWQIVLVAGAIVAAVVALVFCAVRMKRSTRSLRTATISLLSGAVLCAALIVPANLMGVYPRSFPNLTDAYDEYGFVYCFSCSIFDRGVDKPQDYSEERIDEILADLNEAIPTAVTKKPNVIFLQLESFIDVSRLADITFVDASGNAVDPTPFFTSLKASYGSGLLRVPTIGAGTANTEFEMITGMSHHDFGTGEYPYKSFLKKRSCESLPFLLREYGYTSHAIHNHTGTFYERNVAYASLGFDSFIPLEYMSDVEYNSLGWAKDGVLTAQIMNALQSTESSDLVLTISVQGHGKYKKEESPLYTAVSDSVEQSVLDALTYYVGQIAEMDIFIRELTEALAAYGEDTVLVMYGDHLPSLGLTATDFSLGDMYQTDYVIWTNYDVEYEDRDLASYQLASYALLGAEMSVGNVFRLHQSMLVEGISDYDDALRLLEYDMLDGEGYAYDRRFPYEPTDMQFGVLEILVTSVEKKGSGFVVSGENFTEFSVVYLNGKKCKTSFDPESGQLTVSDKSLSDGDKIRVGQVTNDGVVLSKTEGFLFDATP